jgi:hypothetical protein
VPRRRLTDKVTFWHRLDDEILAEACYRKCMAVSGLAWPGLQSRVNLGALLLAQKRHDAALQVLTGAPGATGTWRAALLIGAGRSGLPGGRRIRPHRSRTGGGEVWQRPQE